MKSIRRSPVLTGILFLLAVILLFGGVIGGAQAVLQLSAEYNAQVSLQHIGVLLSERTDANSVPQDISWRFYGSGADGVWTEHTGNLVETMVEDAGDTQIKIGKEYPFYLSVTNRGTVDSYVRVTIYKYWVESNEKANAFGWVHGDGSKRVDLDPKLIRIVPAVNSNWSLQDVTDERMVFYYNGVLAPEGSTDDLTEGLIIDSSIANFVEKQTTQNGDTTVTTYVYAFDGLEFVVEAQVDAVQAKHGERSVPSVWGRGLS